MVRSSELSVSMILIVLPSRGDGVQVSQLSLNVLGQIAGLVQVMIDGDKNDLCW